MNNKYDYNKHYTLKELCELLGIQYNKNHPKLSLNKIKMELELHQISKQKYRIVRELNQTEKEKYKKKHPNIYEKCNYDKFLISWENRNKSGVYKIQLMNEVYIGQTKDFLSRYNHHRRGLDPNANYRIKELMELGATFELLEYEDDVAKRFQSESKYTKEYVNNGYNVINNINVLAKNKNIKMISSKHTTIKIKKDDLEIVLNLLKDKNIFVKKVVKIK